MGGCGFKMNISNCKNVNTFQHLSLKKAKNKHNVISSPFVHNAGFLQGMMCPVDMLYTGVLCFDLFVFLFSGGSQNTGIPLLFRKTDLPCFQTFHLDGNDNATVKADNLYT